MLKTLSQYLADTLLAKLGGNTYLRASFKGTRRSGTLYAYVHRNIHTVYY